MVTALSRNITRVLCFKHHYRKCLLENRGKLVARSSNWCNPPEWSKWMWVVTAVTGLSPIRPCCLRKPGRSHKPIPVSITKSAVEPWTSQMLAWFIDSKNFSRHLYTLSWTFLTLKGCSVIAFSLFSVAFIYLAHDTRPGYMMKRLSQSVCVTFCNQTIMSTTVNVTYHYGGSSRAVYRSRQNIWK